MSEQPACGNPATERARAYTAHWDGTACDSCGAECEWTPDDGVLTCECRERSAVAVYLGDVPRDLG